jgi:NADH:ubiquinone oxidoreductase subunit 5 (subunit L)/multisubunit Na+/H+ antiporter MnhA subunit
MEPKKNQKQESVKTHTQQKLVLEKENYYLIIAGLVVVIIGFILMSGGKWTDANTFNQDEVFSPMRITVAPIVIIIGFVIEIYALFYKPKKNS